MVTGPIQQPSTVPAAARPPAARQPRPTLLGDVHTLARVLAAPRGSEPGGSTSPSTSARSGEGSPSTSGSPRAPEASTPNCSIRRPGWTAGYAC